MRIFTWGRGKRVGGGGQEILISLRISGILRNIAAKCLLLFGAGNCEGIQKSPLAGDTTALGIKPRIEQGTQMGTETNIF
jgi:hypothetical protein